MGLLWGAFLVLEEEALKALVVRNARWAGRLVDVFVEGDRIQAIEPAGLLPPRGTILNASGGFLSPTFADPHIHLDAVLLAHQSPNTSGTLKEGIANWVRVRDGLREDDLLARATTAVQWCVANGVTRLRSHVDTGSRLAVETLVAFKREVSPLVDLQIVAFPQEGVFRAPHQAAELAWAAGAGVDCVGAIPHCEAGTKEGDESIGLAFDLAEKNGLQVDLHCDESDDPASQFILTVCREKRRRSFGAHVIAGHCTAMHSYTEKDAEKAIEAVVESRVQVLANPLDNVVLQGRGDTYPKRRGITRIPELIQAGGLVGIGHDSIMDPWYPLGSGRLLEAASMLVHVSQMTRPDQIQQVFDLLVGDNHLGFGGPPKIEVGAVAEFLVHSVPTPTDAIRLQRAPRFVIRKGQLVAETPVPESRVLDQPLNLGLLD
jgi:cytosine deaminase